MVDSPQDSKQERDEEARRFLKTAQARMDKRRDEAEHPQVLFLPTFDLDHVPNTQRHGSKLNQLVDRWRETFGITHALQTAEPIPWIENAVQFFAAIDSGCNVYVVGRKPHFLHIHTPTVWSSNGKSHVNGLPTIVLGQLRMREPFLGEAPALSYVADTYPGLLWPDPDTLYAIKNYFANEGFLSMAGRQVLHAPLPKGLEADSELSLSRQAFTMRDEAPNGRIELFLTVMDRDKIIGLLRFPLAPEDGHAQVIDRLYQGLGPNLAGLERQRGTVLIQKAVPMRDDYRVLVVGGEPIAGAGRIEALSPLDCDELNSGWDPRLQSQRNSSVIRNDAEATDRYRRDAKLIVSAITKANPMCRDFVMDLATGPGGKTMLVKLLPWKTFRLHAHDVKRAVKAIVKEVQRRHIYGRTSFNRLAEIAESERSD